MSNEVLNILQDVGGKANDMTHGLKQYGNGSMLAGIKGMCMDSHSIGRSQGLKEGVVFGVVGSLAAGVICVCAKRCILKEEIHVKKNTASSWAESINISEWEFNECLEEMGYQVYDPVKNKWQATQKGREHSSSVFGKLYWDIVANFEVMKLRGKKTHKFFYCDRCGAYHKNSIEEQAKSSCICSRCGYETKMK